MRELLEFLARGLVDTPERVRVVVKINKNYEQLDQASRNTLDQLKIPKEAVQAGYATTKIFTTYITPSRAGRMIRFGEIWEIFKVLAREGGLAVIHAEDDDIVRHMYEKLFRENRTGVEHMY